jgi:flagellar basal-body rod protein FlgF
LINTDIYRSRRGTMLRGVYCSNSGLNAMQQKLDVIANNIANVNTEGFKQDKMSFKTFKDEIYGVMPPKIVTDFSAGDLRETGRIYDFAVKGDAFFKIDTPQGARYIRNGSFQSDAAGYLVDNNGNKVVGVTGDVKIVNGKPDQDFYLVSFQNKDNLTKTATGFSAADAVGMSKAENIQVMQGFVENSNVDLIQNMTEMMSIARNYELNSHMMMSQDEILKKAVEEVGSLK